MSAREVSYLQKKRMPLEVSFKFLFKTHESRKKYFMKYFSSFLIFKTLPTIFNVLFIRYTLSNSQQNKKPLNLITIYCVVDAYYEHILSLQSRYL